MLNLIKKVWNAIMNMFKVDGNLSIDTSNVYVNGQKTDLSICKMSDTDYYSLVNEGKCQRNVLYVVSSDFINAYGERIENVAYPEVSSDAATKGYVDDVVGNAQSLTRDDVEQIAKEVFKNSLYSILSSI